MGMDTHFHTAAELLDHARACGKLSALLTQLRRDYQRANIPFPIREHDLASARPEALLQELRESLYLLLMERFDQYLNLMYAADVPERAFRGVQPVDAVEAAGEVAFLLLKREWQKLGYRTRYGGLGGS
jgi:hypothetical protein